MCRAFNPGSSWCFQMREGDPEFRPGWAVHKNRGKIISRDEKKKKKKKFSLKNCFCRAEFSDVRSTFFVNLLSVAESGRVGTGLFYLP